jgi:hypothetical protein
MIKHILTERENVDKWRAKYPDRYKAQMIIYVAKRNKSITEEPFFCGVQKVQSHHPDYSKPLEIVWLCKNHHMEADKIRRRLVHLTGVASGYRIINGRAK